MSTQPIDATTTTAWQELSVHESTLSPDLRGWFAADPERAARLTLPLADLTVDLSKNLVTDETARAAHRGSRTRSAWPTASRRCCAATTST